MSCYCPCIKMLDQPCPVTVPVTRWLISPLLSAVQFPYRSPNINSKQMVSSYDCFRGRVPRVCLCVTICFSYEPKSKNQVKLLQTKRSCFSEKRVKSENGDLLCFQTLNSVFQPMVLSRRFKPRTISGDSLLFLLLRGRVMRTK